MSQSAGEQVGTRPVPGAIGKSSRCVCLACLCVVGALLAGLSLSASAQAAGATVKAWGYNDRGQLGNGTTSTTGCDCISTPVAVGGLSHVVAIAAGNSSNTSMALRGDGAVRSWGENGSGELGNGTTDPSSTPVPVSGLSRVVAIAVGYPNGQALLSNGTVTDWGDNSTGQLGNGTTDPSSTPVPVTGLSHVVAIAAG